MSDDEYIDIDGINESHVTITFTVREDQVMCVDDLRQALLTYFDMQALDGFGKSIAAATITDDDSGKKYKADAQTIQDINTLIETGPRRSAAILSNLDNSNSRK